MALPAVSLTPRGAAQVRAGQPFIAPAEVARAPDDDADVVRLLDPRGRLLGTALWAAKSRIALRVLSRQEETLDGDLLRRRLRQALARRQALFADADAYRVVHGEADGLPGLFVDRYGDAAVLQTAARAMAAREPLIAEAIAAVLGARLLVARNDGSARDMDGLPRCTQVLRQGDQAGTRVRYHDAGLLMEADLLTDGKTGAFLDQQENHACAQAYGRAFHAGGAALDAFTYHGGFALGLARAGLRVLGCDQSPQAIERARRNAELNRLAVDFQVGNAFDLLRSLEASGTRFAVVVIDPPALLKRGQGRAADATAALRAYKELNLRALRLLQPDGLLFSCSCSGRLGPAAFEEMLLQAARDAGRPAQVLERRGAGRDHPPLLGVPETEYLKCWVLRAL